MNTERDKFLTEAMGECWHEKDIVRPLKSHGLCTCGIDEKSHFALLDHLEGINNNFSTWEGFGKLFTWAQKQEWWDRFSVEMNGHVESWREYLIHPDSFADAVYESLKEGGE